MAERKNSLAAETETSDREIVFTRVFDNTSQ